MSKISLLLLCLGCLFWVACATPVKPIGQEESRLQKATIEHWKAERTKEITASDGWLSLAGLFWLKEGVTAFGSDTMNKFVFPESAPAEIGQFILKNGMVTMIIEEAVPVKSGKTSPKNIVLVEQK